MNTVKIAKESVFMIAHRGLSGLEPENSVPAFIAAGNRSYYGIETDVHVTKDGKFVVIHDDDTDRVAGEFLSVEGSTYEALRKVVLSDLCRLEIEAGVKKKGLKKRKELFIPSLEDYIAICKKYEKRCILELKNLFVPEDIERLVKEIRELDYLEHVVFISFERANMTELRRMLPDQPLQYLVKQYSQEVLDVLKQYQLDLDIKYTALSREIVEEVHANGRKVNCWTCDSKEAAEQLVSWGVDFITSNYLE